MANSTTLGAGHLGSTCGEIDVWEANRVSTAFASHACTSPVQDFCEGSQCGGQYSWNRYRGRCDPDGCDFNSWRLGNRTFYGPGAGFAVDTTRKMTVVTQFPVGADGNLTEIRRFYVQDGTVIPNAHSAVAGITGNSITPDFCSAQKAVFGDRDDFAKKGGFATVGDAVRGDMVMAISLWDDVSGPPVVQPFLPSPLASRNETLRGGWLPLR